MPGSGDAFVGRHGELAHLTAALEASGAGKGQLVLLSGEPGIGKTRIAAELALRAEAAGARVLWGRCHQEPGAPPYWCWTQVLRDLAEALDDLALQADLGNGAPEIAGILPELGERMPGLAPPMPPDDPAQARFRLFAALSRFLLAASRRRPMVLVLDDVHWADAASLRFLRFLAPDLADSRLLLVVTCQEDELSRQHPLSDALGDLTRSPSASRLPLSGLAAEEVGALMAATAGAAPPPALVRSLHRLTEGNPLFLREIIRFLRDRCVLAGSASRMTSPASLRIPDGVREVIGQRLNLLSPGCNDVLRVAAVIGRDFSLDLLRRACGGDSDAVPAAIDEALDARIIEEPRANNYQFTHVLIRMTLYDELRAGQRRLLHRAVVEAIEALPRRESDQARHMYRATGQTSRTTPVAVRAGIRADAMRAVEDAAAFFQAALDLMQQQAPPPALVAQMPGPGELTAREAEVLSLIAMGRTNADIALVLSIGVTTVATHVRSVLNKTGTANRTEAAALALRQGTPPSS
ncbi:helix-turn-helix transcriptional regulator [Humitalea sp. 24SJ18S-53]|uniref:helix-turn-helix transcriptional regulator n=1 Tax=Humitalea sp. 24SJ18S-53 TaxID=3422307 RepID=UPI003D66EC3C